jgi:hypothetical protein
MLLPLIGFIVCVIVSTSVGIIVLAIHPKWKISILNLALFGFGSFSSAIIISAIYTFLFSNNGTLESAAAVICYFILLMISVIIGGILSIYYGRKILKSDRKL